jgi:hypothetical protein
MSAHQQIKFILDSGWSGGQNVVPNLNPGRWSRHYLIPKLVPVQAAWANEHSLPEKRRNLRDILAEQLTAIQPDVIYLSDLTSFDFSILDELACRPLVVAWLASRLPSGVPWQRIDLLLSGIGAIRTAALSKGVKDTANFNSAAPNYQLTAGCDSDYESRGIAFSGSFLGGYHDERAQSFIRLAGAIDSVPFTIFTENRFSVPPGCRLRFESAVYASKVIETYSRHRVVVDARADFGLDESRYNRETSNMRIFEATRAGSLLLTEYAPNLESMFDLETEIVCYRSDDELISKARYFTSEAGATSAGRIAQNGFRRTLSEHTIERRAERFDDLVSSRL